MLQATIYFQTGTGNSLRASRWIEAEVTARGGRSTLQAMAAARPAEEVAPGEDRYLILCFPTHGFITPWSVLRFLLTRLPPGRGARAIVIAMRGAFRHGRLFIPGLLGVAAHLAALLLFLKGYRIRGIRGLHLPANWMAVHPGLSPVDATAMFDRAEPDFRDFLSRIFSGQRCLWGNADLILGIPLLPLALAYLLLGRFNLAKMFFASERCTGCGSCARQCPQKAIRMLPVAAGSRPYWTFSCESCMRCLACCPHQAVEVYQPLFLGWYYLTIFPVAGKLLAWLGQQGVEPAPWVSLVLIRWPVQIAWMFLALWAGYRVFHFLAGYRSLARFFAVTTLTRWYRRYHDPALPCER